MMNVKYIDLGKQFLNHEDEIRRAMNNVLTRGDFINGDDVKLFAKEFSEAYSDVEVIPVANGTDALYISLKALGIGPGDEVITTASSWISTSETITQCGARPVFVDIDDYNTIDTTQVEAKITDKTRAIIPVHLYGQMCDIEKLLDIANKYDIHIVEDCAQSHFSKYNGQLAGSFGKTGTFSFYPGKNLGAYGDAGAIITRDHDLAQRMKAYASHGALIKHNHFMEGMNSRLDTLQAAVLRVKLKYIEDWTKQRNKVALAYDHLFSEELNVKTPKRRSETYHSFHVYSIMHPRRDDLKKYLFQNGIETQIHYPVALPNMDAYKYLNHVESDFPKATNLQKSALSLPIYPEIEMDELEYVAEKICEFNRKHGY